MSIETGLVIVALIWGAYVLMKINRRRQTFGRTSDTLVGRPEPQNREMPRIGEPGSVTYNQIRALQENNFEPDKNWSREEAALILDAVKYLRAVCRDVAESDEDDGPPPLAIQNELLRFILTEQDLREYVRKWGEERRESGHGDFDEDHPALVQNNQYSRVEAKAAEFFVDEADKAADQK